MRFKPAVQIFILCLSLSGCASSDVQKVTKQYNAAVTALATERKAEAHKDAIAADLASREKIALKIGTPAADKVVDDLLNMSLSMGNPDLSPAVLETQVQTLLQANTKLQTQLAQQALDAVRAQQADTVKTNKLESQLGAVSIAQAKVADQERADSAWFGIPGIIRHAGQLMGWVFWGGIIVLVGGGILWIVGEFYPPLGIVETFLGGALNFGFGLFKSFTSAIFGLFRSVLGTTTTKT